MTSFCVQNVSEKEDEAEQWQKRDFERPSFLFVLLNLNCVCVSKSPQTPFESRRIIYLFIEYGKKEVQVINN